MKKNVGGIDRLFRFGIGFLSLGIVFAADNTAMHILFGLVALIGLGTAAMGYCPINDKMGLNTAVEKEK